ncbi:acyl-CoA synthetase [Rhodopila globiformis]|uniref:Acyl-CoA synthetase n=1 Tax=Rhodopila globiformis TaxID=1071 RepID=A0A2S6MU83_RHOGL|nr:acyl-CoA synthetase [Rhodopila globiformis]PPQ25923.1 acyl-CoA synthetase [Rhodopila globiformis]
MSIGSYAARDPDRAAIIDSSTGETVTYRQLDERSNRFAQYLHAAGLRRGDTVALFMENNLRFLEIVWAARRSGLYLTAVNRYLTADEAAYIVADCDAQVLVSSFARADVAASLPARLPQCRHFLMTDGTIDGWTSYEAATAAHPPRPLDEQWLGDLMLYSSGTTGRPKGVRRPLQPVKFDQDDALMQFVRGYGFNEATVYLSPAPLYHAAPLIFSIGVHGTGGTIVMMPRFDPETVLALIEQYKVTHSQFVPTMFVRMLKLPEDVRHRYDLSSHRVAIHAAAPCPVEVKRAMIDWWGPIIHEYYGGTEGNGMTRIESAEWLAHPGSVGRPIIGVLHICDEEGRDLPAGEPGIVYFERETMPFSYYKDPERTRASQHPLHPNWSTLGDVGYVDADGYLYLTDRKAFMIISGGVNIYPREIEDRLVGHPAVRDVAVFGLPDPDMGEQVKAVVELMDGRAASHALEEELIAYARSHLAHYKVPKTVDFTDALPRLPTGKLYKQGLRREYLARMNPPAVSTTGAR